MDFILSLLEPEQRQLREETAALCHDERGALDEAPALPPADRLGRACRRFCADRARGGTDVAALATTARRDGDCYVLDSRKTFIGMAPDADLYTVVAKTDPSAGNKGITAFIVEKGTAGFNHGPRMDMLAPYPIDEPSFEACRVPVATGSATRMLASKWQ